jgi:hypothetical protein
MKTNRFLSAAICLAISSAMFFSCSSSDDPPADEPSNSSGVAVCGETEYDSNIYRCEYGELVGKCNGGDYRPAYQVCSEGVIQDINPPSSSSEWSGEPVLLCGEKEYDSGVYRCESGELIGKCKGVDFYPAYQVCNDGVIQDKNPPSSSSVRSSGSVSSSSNVVSSSSKVPQVFGYCDYGPFITQPDGEVTGGCYPMATEDDAANCALWGNVVNSCGNGIFGYCDYGPIVTQADGKETGGCYPMATEDDAANCALWGNVVGSCGDTPSSSSLVSSSSSVFVPTYETFLGIGYDVIESAYINPKDAVKNRNNPVLDQGKMFQDGIITNSSTYQENFQTVAGSTIKEVIVERSKKIGVSVNGGFFFSGSIGGEFENKENVGKKLSIFFAKLNYYRYTEDHKINAATAQNLVKYLTEDFKSDLSGKTASQILNLYGTHVFIQYYKGGALEANYTYTGSELTSSEEVRMAAAGSFKIIPGMGANVTGDVSTSTNTTEFEKTDNLTFNYQAFGGKAIGTNSLSDLKAEFGGWAGSISGKEEICGIANFNSLIPIWDLAAAGGYASEAAKLKTEFDTRASKVNIPLARKYTIEYYHSNVTTNPIINGTNTLRPPTGGTIAELEIYTLGGGGGGQGGDRDEDLLFPDKGTGGAGGGGAATYVKLGGLLDKNESISLEVTIGNGGTGGSYYSGSTGNSSGYNGGDGKPTKVIYKSVTVTANGGSGAGGTGTQTKGGAAGRKESILPTGILDGTSEYGEPGNDGDWDDEVKSVGGNAAKITIGTLGGFGGYNGAVRPVGGASLQSPGYGGGGRGGYEKENGTAGKEGLVSIVVKSYTDE